MAPREGRRDAYGRMVPKLRTWVPNVHSRGLLEHYVVDNDYYRAFGWAICGAYIGFADESSGDRCKSCTSILEKALERD